MKPIFEHVRCPLEAAFACHRFDAATFDCPYHVHPEIEILRIDESRGWFLVGDQTGHFGPGDFFLLGSGLPHMFCNDEPHGEIQPHACSRYVQFLPNCLGEQIFRLPELTEVAGLLQRSTRGLYYEAGTTPSTVERSFGELFAADGVHRISGLLHLLANLAGTGTSLPLASVGFVPIADARSSERVRRSLAYIHSALASGGKIDLTGAARAAAISPQAFSRFFRRHLGRTFQDYVTDLRVSRACRLLIDTDATVAEICFQAGFNNLANFNRHFLRCKGMNPVRYRKLSVRV